MSAFDPKADISAFRDFPRLFTVLERQQPPRQGAWYRFLIFPGAAVKKLAIAIAAIALVAAPACAADMAVKAPPPAAPVAPIINWTGWYVGGNLGGVLEHASGTSDF